MYLKRKWKNEIVLQANEVVLTDSTEGEEMEDKQEAWFWISDYCRKHGLIPWNSEIYALVYKKYIESKK